MRPITNISGVNTKDNTNYFKLVIPMALVSLVMILLLFIFEINNRSNKEKTISENTMALNDILQGSPIPQFVIDKNHQVLCWNHAMEKYSGIKANDIIGTDQHWKAFYDKKRPCMVDLLVDGKEDEFFQWYGKKFNKSVLVDGAYESIDYFPTMGENGAWLYDTASVIRDSLGNIIGAIQTNIDITERKQVEEALRESERKFRAIFDQSFEFIGLMTIDGTLIEANKTAISFIGAKESDVIGRPFWETPWWSHTPRLSEEVHAAIKKAAKGELVRFEAVHIAANGSQHCFDFSIKPVMNEIGQVVLLIPEGRDISERKHTERDLRESEEKYRELVESANVIILKMDNHGNITFFNEYAQQFFGYSEPEIIGKNVLGLIVPKKDSSGMNMKVAMKNLVSNTGRYTRNVNENIRRNGERVWVSWTNKAILDESGAQVGVLSIGNDITERKHAEENLRRTNRALKAISTCSDAMVHATNETDLLRDICRIIVDVGGYRMAWIGYAENDETKTVRPMAYMGYENGYLKLVNVTWKDTERGRGPTGTAIRTRNPSIIRYTLTDTTFNPWRDEALKRGYASVLGLPLISGDHMLGALTIYSEKSDAFDAEEVALLKELVDSLSYGITTLRDRTQRSQAEKDLEIAKNQAELYLDLIGHDINNMNQIGIGFLELALNTLDLKDEARSLISKPLEALESSTRLIDNVRKLHRLKNDVRRFHMIDVGHVIREVIPNYSHVSNRDINITFSTDCICRVIANELISDVFSNILGNAIKHSSGPLSINIFLNKDTMNNNDYCKVIIEDNGPGIPDEMKNKLFLRFQRGNTKASGKGLGLFLVKTLIEDYNGLVWVEDRVTGYYNKGCRFVIMLPLIKE